MNTVVINPDFVETKDIEQVKYKARAIIVNKKTGEIAINLCWDQYMFPGGGIENKEEKIRELGRILQKYKKLSEDEAYNAAYAWVVSKFTEEVAGKQEKAVEGLIREIAEELGIKLNKEDITPKPFLEIKRIDKNLDVNENARGVPDTINRETITDFFIATTDKKMDNKRTQLSLDEKRGHLKTYYMKINEAIEAVNEKKKTALDRKNKIYHQEFDIVMDSFVPLVLESNEDWAKLIKEQIVQKDDATKISRDD